MLALILVTASFSLAPLLADLSRQARTRAKQVRLSPPDRDDLPPGSYNFGGLSFTLAKPLISSNSRSIAGYATAHSVLAAVSPSVLSQKVFVDAGTQTLFQIRDAFAIDNDVTFYNVSILNPLSVFVNLRMQSVASEGFDCVTIPGVTYGRQCENRLDHRWNDTSHRPIPYEVENLKGVQLLFGASLKFGTSVSCTLSTSNHLIKDRDRFHSFCDLIYSINFSDCSIQFTKCQTSSTSTFAIILKSFCFKTFMISANDFFVALSEHCPLLRISQINNGTF
jgi:hypothetical protein